MTRPSNLQPGSGRRRGAGVFLAFAIAFLTADRAVEARCGGAPASSREGGSSLSRLEILADDPSAMSLHEGPHEPWSVPSDAPGCSGPSCSNRIPPPLPGRGFETASVRGDGLADLGTVPPPARRSRPLRVADDPFELPSAPSGVFHPPRWAS